MASFVEMVQLLLYEHLVNAVLQLFFFLAVGFLQLAGGTNAHTVDGMKKERLFQTKAVSGIDFTC